MRAIMWALLLAAGTAVLADEPAKPLYGTWGFNLAGADATVKPGDDFFRYANGRWLDGNSIPGDRMYLDPGQRVRLW